MPKYQALRGMQDILPEEAESFHWIEENAREVFDLYGFREIRTPFLESTEVFSRSIGENTDIVEKEMYSFLDRGGKHISLRPEGTASIVRAYIEHGLAGEKDISKFFYMGPMFRGERPQKGRLRQFSQIGAEILGGSEPSIDAELILSLKTLFEKLNISDYKLLINSLGCKNDRVKYRKILKDFLKDNKTVLCDNCNRRSEKNVLRVLDCKKVECRSLMKASPNINDFLCDACKDDYGRLKSLLTSCNISYAENSSLVRGLDYYTGTVFEAVHPDLGAQDAIAAGGRFDTLVKQMGGPEVGAVGYAVGVERLLLSVSKELIPKYNFGMLVIPAGGLKNDDVLGIVNELRANGVRCDMDHSGRSLKSMLRKANRDKREKVLIVGEDEMKSGEYLLKNMSDNTQKNVTLEELVGQGGCF